MATRYSRCLALVSNGTVRGWGSATPPSYLTNIVAIGAGDYASFAIRESGVFIVEQPQSVTVLAGTNVTLKVSAVGVSPLTYQWLKDGTNIAGATDASLTRTNVQDVDAGNYMVNLATTAGENLSAPATLTVLSPPRF